MSRRIRFPIGDAPKVVQTPAVAEVIEIIDFLTEMREIGAILGGAGLGKTFSVDTATAATGLPVVTLDVPPRPAPKEVTVRLLKAVCGFADVGATAYELTEELAEVMAQEPRIVIIDEAQNLTAEGLNQVRYLHDRPDADWALVFVGGQDAARSLHSQKQLESRVARWQRFEPMRGDELIRSLRSYHEIFQFAPAELLLEIDKVHAHGRWRNWARFLQTALILQKKSGHDVLDRRFAAAVIHATKATR